MLGKAFILLQVPQVVTEWVAQANVGPVMFLILIEAAFTVLGVFMEGIAVMFVMVPVVYPTAELLGINTLLLGVIFTICVLIAGITPPVAVPLYASSGLFDVPFESLVRMVWPFLIAIALTMVLITVYPPISLWLPDLVFG